MDERKDEAVRRLHSLVCGLAFAYKGYLPHEGSFGEFTSANAGLSADTRTRLASIEDAVKKADEIVAMLKQPDLVLKPTKDEQALWDRGEKISAIKAFRERTFSRLDVAYCAFNGITVEEYRNRKSRPE